MPFITVVANASLEGPWGKTQKREICSRDRLLHSFDVTWVLSYRKLWDLESKIAEEWSMKDLTGSAIRELSESGFPLYGRHVYCSGRVEFFYPGET